MRYRARKSAKRAKSTLKSQGKLRQTPSSRSRKNRRRVITDYSGRARQRTEEGGSEAPLCLINLMAQMLLSLEEYRNRLGLGGRCH